MWDECGITPLNHIPFLILKYKIPEHVNVSKKNLCELMSTSLKGFQPSGRHLNYLISDLRALAHPGPRQTDCTPFHLQKAVKCPESCKLIYYKLILMLILAWKLLKRYDCDPNFSEFLYVVPISKICFLKLAFGIGC